MNSRHEDFASGPPSTWREDLQAALPGTEAAEAVWLGNLNARYPWRTIVGEIRLADGRQIVLKYQTDEEQMAREWAAFRLLREPGAPHVAPAFLGGDQTRRVLAFERVAGVELTEALEGKQAGMSWLQAARAVGGLHRWAAGLSSRWLELCLPAGASGGLPVYDLPMEALVAPFRKAGADADAVSAAISAARQVYVEPGSWLCFTHGDLQTRHFVCTEGGVRIVDWERAGLRHRLYDLACLIAKPINHGRRLPRWAAEAAVLEYARVCGLDPDAVRRELALVLAYEHLIGVAELDLGETGLPEARACLEALIPLGDRDARLAPVSDAAPALLERLPGEDLPLFAGFEGREASVA